MQASTIYVLLALLFTQVLCSGQIVQIPDPILKDILVNSKVADFDDDGTSDDDVDTNNDGEIQLIEAEAVIRLRLDYKEISSLSGVEKFSNLRQLNIRSNNLQEIIFEDMPNLEIINFEQNELLERVSFKGSNKITAFSFEMNYAHLDLQNTNEEIVRAYLYSDYPHADSLVALDNDISGYLPISAKTINYLDIRDNNIDSVFIYHDFLLVGTIDKLMLEGNPISYIELGNIPGLNIDLDKIASTLEVFKETKVYEDTLELNNFPLLHTINSGAKVITLCNLPSITQIDQSDDFSGAENWTLKNLENLKTISFAGHKFDLAELPALNSIYISVIDANNIIFQDLPSLDSIVCNYIDSADTLIFRNLEELTYLNLHEGFDGEIAQVVIENCESMVKLFHEEKHFYNLRIINDLVVKNMPNLEKVFLCYGGSSEIGPRKKLTLQNLPALDSLDFENLRFTDTMHIKELPSLRSFKIENGSNDDENYTFSNLESLTSFYWVDIRSNKIDLSKISSLENIFISRSFGELDLGYQANLKDLNLNFVYPNELMLNGYQFLQNIYLFSTFLEDVPLKLELNNLPSLTSLFTINNLDSDIFYIDDFPSLSHITFRDYNNVSDKMPLILSNLPVLKSINTNQFINPDNNSNYNLSGLLNMTHVDIDGDITGVNIENMPSLNVFHFDGEWDTEDHFFDFSSCPNIDSIYLLASGLHTADFNLKNGSNSLSSLITDCKIRNICVDNQEEEDHLKTINSELENSFFVTDCPNNIIKTFNTIKGKISFANDPVDCGFTNLNIGYNKVHIISDSYNATLFSDDKGDFEFVCDNINEEIIITPVLENSIHFELNEESKIVSFADYDNLEDVEFCLSPLDPHTDYEVLLIPIGTAVPGFESGYKLVVKNLGSTALDSPGKIDFTYNPNLMTFISGSSNIVSVAPDSINWFISSLLPFSQKEETIVFELNKPTDNPPLNQGDTLKFKLEIAESFMPDDFDTNNLVEHSQVVVNSFDPNDIQCLEGDVLPTSFIGNEIHYMIRFENEGNGPAKNIYITNALDSNVFDLESFMPLYASHRMATEYVAEDTVRFNFNDINLPHTDENRGQLVYKIKIKDGIDPASILENDAYIYFDFNLPIYTELSEVVFIDKSVNTYFHSVDKEVIIYPNPVQRFLKFDSHLPIIEYSVFNFEGQLLLNGVTDNQINGILDLESLSKGVYIIFFKDSKGLIHEIPCIKIE